MSYFEAINGYLKTFSKFIKEDENMSLKNKTLIGGWILIASKVYRHENLCCRFQGWLYKQCRIKRQTSYNYSNLYKLMNVPFTIYAELECLLEKMHSCQNNPEKSSTEKNTKHIPSGFSLFTSFSFDSAKNKLDCYRDKDCMERFCKGLKEHATRIINYEKKKKR